MLTNTYKQTFVNNSESCQNNNSEYQQASYYVAKPVSFTFMTNHCHSLVSKPICQKLVCNDAYKTDWWRYNNIKFGSSERFNEWIRFLDLTTSDQELGFERSGPVQTSLTNSMTRII